jgi:hypothetical protein
MGAEMSMANQTWIHIGFPKCASTSLQRGFFAKCPCLDFVGRDDNWQKNVPSHHLPLLQLGTLDEVHYQRNRQQIEDSLLGSFREGDFTRVLSDEILVSGRRPYLRTIPVADPQLVADRLHSLFPEAEILMIIRNQVTFLESMAAQLIRNNKVRLDLDDFYTLQRRHAEQGCGSFFDLPDYYAIFDLYEQTFGKGRVHVILLEDLGRKPLETMSQLIEWMGLTQRVHPEDYLPERQNTRATHLELYEAKYRKYYKKALNCVPLPLRRAVTVPAKKFLARMTTIKYTFSPEQLAFLDSFYGPGNEKLEAATGCALAAAGYPVTTRTICREGE